MQCQLIVFIKISSARHGYKSAEGKFLVFNKITNDLISESVLLC